MKKVLWVWVLVLWTGWAWAQPPVPMLWKVAGKGTQSVYLLGSFHMLRDSDYPLAPSVDAAVADAQTLVFEVAPQEMQSPDLPAKMNKAALRTDGKTLQQSLAPKTWAALQAYAAKTGMPIAALQPYKPWFVALAMTLAEFQKLGFSPALGLDQYLMHEAERKRKAVRGLESAEAQIQLLDSLDSGLQGDFLAETLMDLQDMRDQSEELHTAWRNGDDVALDKLSVGDMRERFPALYQRVNVNRNRAWLPQVEALLQRGSSGNALVVVGALHLVGSDGLVQMLQARGYRVQRLR